MLRHLSRFLGALAYETQQVAETQPALRILEAESPDFLIIDAEMAADGAWEVCKRVGRPGRLHPVYTLLMIESPEPRDVTQALEAGVDDFLAKPIVHAELLARLRAGARVLEQDRRLRRQSPVDPKTGLPSAFALENRAREELARDGKDYVPPACVLIDLDGFRVVNRVYGVSAGDVLLKAVSDRLATLCSPEAFLASLGSDRFGVLLPGKSASEAAAWAKEVHRQLGKEPFELGDEAIRLTASFGIAGCQEGIPSAARLIEQAAEALQTAKNSGRNCIVSFGQFDHETAAWTELATPGKLFERTVARHVMTPCTLLLRPQQTMRQAAALIRRTGVNEAPVVDDRGSLAGLLSREKALEYARAAKPPRQTVADLMETNPVTHDEETPLAELIERFNEGDHSAIVILRDGQPTGLVTTEGLASLSQPLTIASFSSDVSCTAGSDYLLVPDLAPAADAP